MGAAPPSGAQGHTQPRLSGLVVLVKVQPEAQEPETLIRAGRQQHQELLHDALETRRGIHVGRAVPGGGVSGGALSPGVGGGLSPGVGGGDSVPGRGGPSPMASRGLGFLSTSRILHKRPGGGPWQEEIPVCTNTNAGSIDFI